MPKPVPSLIPALILAAALVGGPVLAQSRGESADISGYWEFETKVYDYGCKMTGEMTIAPGENAGEYVGQLIAREKCGGFVGPDGQELDPVEYYAEQTVLAHRDGDQLTITSTLDLVLPSPETYAPDDFVVTIVDSSLMTGELRSADIAPVTFFRGQGPIA